MRFLISAMLATAVLVGSTAMSEAADGKLGVTLVERNGKVVILRVDKNSGAESVGIRPGDILVKVGTTNVRTIQDALDAKEVADNDVDVPFIFSTPGGGLWAINAKFEEGVPYASYSATNPRPN